MFTAKHKHTSFGKVTRRAYAKINLYLDVLACREDGFHDLLTVMHAISLHDDVTIECFSAAFFCNRFQAFINLSFITNIHFGKTAGHSITLCTMCFGDLSYGCAYAGIPSKDYQTLSFKSSKIKFRFYIAV